MTTRHPISDSNVLVIGICDLCIVIWDFGAVYGKANRFYLNQLELPLTFPYLVIIIPILFSILYGIGNRRRNDLGSFKSIGWNNGILDY